MNWTDKNEQWLRKAVAEHPEMTKPELRSWCRKNYPYSVRSGYAYKAWLLALRRYFKPESIKPRAPRLSRAERYEAAGQQRLIP